MPGSPHTVLVTVVERYRKSGEPVAAAALAVSGEGADPTLDDQLETLCSFELLEATPEGYRPTVTAFELLEAGIELDETVVLDVVEE